MDLKTAMDKLIEAARTRLSTIRARCEDIAGQSLEKLERGETIPPEEVRAWRSARIAHDLVRQEVRQLEAMQREAAR